MRDAGFAVVLILGLSFGTSLVSDVGDSASPEFYGIVAQILPILLLALLVDIMGGQPLREYRRLLEEYARLEELTAENARQARKVREEIEAMRAEAERRDVEWTDELEQRSREWVEKADSAATAGSGRWGEVPGVLRELGLGHRRRSVGYVLVAAVGEAAALYAVACESSTTFLLMATILSMVSMVVLFVTGFVERYELPSG